MLGAAGDGELEPDMMREVAHHLMGCASCTGYGMRLLYR